MLGLGLGMGVGNKAPLLPVSAYPTIADIPPGALVLDSDGVVKKKRFVVELNGPDTITFPPVSTDMKNNDWEISLVFNDINPAQSRYSDILRVRKTSEFGAIIFLIYINPSKKLACELRNDGVAYQSVVTTGILGQNFEKVRVTKVGTAITLYALGEVKTIDSGGWNAENAFISIVSDYEGQARPLQVSGIQQVLNGVPLDCFPCDSETGTVIANQCRPSRPATLSDATAHVRALVPVSLLT